MQQAQWDSEQYEEEERARHEQEMQQVELESEHYEPNLMIPMSMIATMTMIVIISILMTIIDNSRANLNFVVFILFLNYFNHIKFRVRNSHSHMEYNKQQS